MRLLGRPACTTGSEIELVGLHRGRAASKVRPEVLERQVLEGSSNDFAPYDIEDEFEALADIRRPANIPARRRTASELAAQALDLRRELAKLRVDLLEAAEQNADDQNSAYEIRSLLKEVSQLKIVTRTCGNALVESVQGR